MPGGHLTAEGNLLPRPLAASPLIVRPDEMRKRLLLSAARILFTVALIVTVLGYLMALSRRT